MNKELRLMLVDYALEKEMNLRIAAELFLAQSDVLSRIVEAFLKKMKEKLVSESFEFNSERKEKPPFYGFYLKLRKSEWRTNCGIGISDHDSDRVHFFIINDRSDAPEFKMKFPDFKISASMSL